MPKQTMPYPQISASRRVGVRAIDFASWTLDELKRFVARAESEISNREFERGMKFMLERFKSKAPPVPAKPAGHQRPSPRRPRR